MTENTGWPENLRNKYSHPTSFWAVTGEPSSREDTGVPFVVERVVCIGMKSDNQAVAALYKAWQQISEQLPHYNAMLQIRLTKGSDNLYGVVLLGEILTVHEVGLHDESAAPIASPHENAMVVMNRLCEHLIDQGICPTMDLGL